MKLLTLLERMITQVTENDPTDTYSILLGVTPLTDTQWAHGRKEYGGFPISHTRLVPNYLVVLAPSPENNRTGNLLFEFTVESTTARSPATASPTTPVLPRSTMSNHVLRQWSSSADTTPP